MLHAVMAPDARERREWSAAVKMHTSSHSSAQQFTMGTWQQLAG
jgi:hypothetical protein